MARRPKERLHLLGSLFWVGSIVFGAIYVKLMVTHSSSDSENDFTFELKLFSASMCVTLFLLGFLLQDLANKDPAASHSLSSLFAQYFMVQISSRIGKYYLNKFIRRTKDVASTQEQYLMKLLKSNAATDYGKAHKFAAMKSMEDFRTNHPITTYGYLEPYIDQVCNTNRNALTKSDPMFITRTSGTTGKFKKIPVSGESQSAFLKLIPLLMYIPVMKGVKPNLQKLFSLTCQPTVETTATGLKIAPLSFFYYNHASFMVSPKAASEIMSERSAYYVHGLFILAERDVGSMMIGFTHQCYAFFKFLTNNIESLCNDIAQGTICDGLDLEENLYGILRAEVKPDPGRADEIQKVFQKGSIGLAKRLWPGLQFCRSVGTGAMTIYTTHVLQSYMKDVKFIYTMFGGSEGIYALSVTSDYTDPSYTLAYQLGFFEFLPEQYLGGQDIKDKLVLAHLVEPNCKYEVVVTNQNGLYRYRTGDVVLVTSLCNQCPVMEVLYRTGQVVNLAGERSTEDVICQALVKATEALDTRLMDYTLCEDVYFYGIKALKDDARKYVLFIETDKKLKPKDMQKFDEALCELSEPYNHLRSGRKTIDPMHVTQVKPSTFIQLKDTMTKGASNPQFKIPRALRTKEYLDFLMQNKW